MSVPNYPVFDAAGNLYVSDSGAWKENGGCLFRIRPGGETEVVGEGSRRFPNGMALHPDGSRLYVVLSNMPGVVSLALATDGSVGAPQTVVELPRHVPDGLAFDVAGNLYIACYTPDVIYRPRRTAISRSSPKIGKASPSPPRRTSPSRAGAAHPGRRQPLALAPDQGRDADRRERGSGIRSL